MKNNYAFKFQSIFKGNCSVRGIGSNNDIGEDNEFEADQASQQGFVMRMKTPAAFLNLDKTYIHTGKRLVNGIISDKFIAEDVLSDSNVIYEYAFSSSGVNVSNEEKDETMVPLSLDLQYPSVFF